MKEMGPIYGVELLDTLPLWGGPMLQQLPSRNDLELSRRLGDRLAAGYEVLLSHYRRALAESKRLQSDLAIARETIACLPAMRSEASGGHDASSAKRR